MAPDLRLSRSGREDSNLRPLDPQSTALNQTAPRPGIGEANLPDPPAYQPDRRSEICLGSRPWNALRSAPRASRSARYCLGAMMFGAWGNTDHDESPSRSSTRPSTAASTSSTPPTSTPPASPRRSSARRSQGRRDEVVLATKFTSRWGRLQPPRQRPVAGSSRAVEDSLRRLRHRLHRPVPGAPARSAHRHRRDAGRAVRPRPPGQGPRHRQLHLPRRADRGGPVGRRAARTRAVPLRAAALLDLRPRHRDGRAARPVSSTGWA